MKYFLDTNIIIYAIKGKYPNIIKRFLKVPYQSIVLPSIVIAELELGAKKSANYKKVTKKYEEFINLFDEVSFDNKAAKIYADIRYDLEKKGAIIGPNDLIIAATVLANDGILVTHNVKEFNRVKDLKIEDWTEEE